jgi:hypothetical protein
LIRNTVKSWGENQIHYQIIGDFYGYDKGELFFWNQGARKLFVSDIPHDPTEEKNWIINEVFSWEGQNYEGFASADMDMDGVQDVIGGGLWFSFDKRDGYVLHKIDDYSSSRTAAGDLIKGGRPEVIIGSGDQSGPLNLYFFEGGQWSMRTLIPMLQNGHTLQIQDFNQDGNPDIYTAEMHTPGAGESARQIILYGDGKGNFRKHILSLGSGTHEGKTGDLDGDGDIDILQKDFNHQRRINIWLNRGAFSRDDQVRIDEIFYKGSTHYKVSTSNAIYYLEKSSGGFSSILDLTGRDWIQYHSSGNTSFPESAGSDFRGLPNMIYASRYDNGAGHPGFNAVDFSEVIDKNQIRFTSKSGNFIWKYTFFPSHAKLEIEDAPADQNYWFLYEGPVGGSFNPFTKYWGSNIGMHTGIPNFLKGETIEDTWQWVYFGDKNQ